MKYLSISAIMCCFLVSFAANAQKKEEVVQSVRDRYYRITGGKVALQNYTVGNYRVSAEKGRVAIIKEPVDDGVFEYYFDTKTGLAYFIYFASKNNKLNPDLRGYYDSSGQMVWFKENTEEITIGFYEIPFKYLYLQAMNAYHSVENRDLPTYPQSLSIDEYIQSVHAMKTQPDTLAYIFEPDEGYYEEWDVEFRNQNNEKVMTQRGAGGEHGSNATTVYFRDGQKLCEISKSTGWIGSYDNTEILISYFKEGKLFREEKYKSYGQDILDSESVFGFNREGVVPQVRVF